MPPTQTPPMQPTVTKLTMTPKAVTAKTSTFSKKAVQFPSKTTITSSLKTMTPVRKLTSTVATIDVQDDEEVVTVTLDDKLTLTDNEIGNLFQDTSS